MPQMLTVEVYENAQEATEAGRVYVDTHTTLALTTAVVVREGTKEGNATVDFLLEDDKGNKYAAIITMSLLRALTR